MGRLEGRVAVVTGAAAGIGRAAVLRFLQEGARVLAVDLDPEGLAALSREGASESLHTLRADVSSRAGVEEMIETSAQRFGGLDSLYNNAGVVPQGTIEQTTEEEWDRQITINLKSVFLGCKLALPELRRSGRGAVVSTASVAGMVGVPNRAAYCASKAAIIGLTKALAKDYAGERIRFNCVCPGTVDTPSWRKRVESAADPEEAMRSFIARQPMGRVATAEEVAAGALYLLSEEAAFITGVCLTIDGGWTA